MGRTSLCKSCRKVDWGALRSAAIEALVSQEGVLLADLGLGFESQPESCTICALFKGLDIPAQRLHLMVQPDSASYTPLEDFRGRWELRAFDFWSVWNYTRQMGPSETLDEPPKMPLGPTGVYYCLARFEVGYYGFGQNTYTHPATFHADHLLPLSRGLVICSDIKNLQSFSLDCENWSLRRLSKSRKVSEWVNNIAEVTSIRRRPGRHSESQSLQRVYKPTKVLEWLKESSKMAPICKRPGSIDGMKLIDCENGRIIKNTDSKKNDWVALSYSWSLADNNMVDFEAPTSLNQKMMQQDYLPSRIPKVIQQAMTVVRDLGLRYLWVDKYCIKQEDTMEKEHQMSQMDKIFALASLTIVAASTDGLLPGVASEPRLERDHVWLQQHNLALFQLGPDGESLKSEAFWHSRGWTYQEDLLSQQVLYFTDTHAYLSRRGYIWSDILPTSDPKITTRRQSFHRGSMLDRLLDGNENRGRQVGLELNYPILEQQGETLSEYLELIEFFSARSLTFDSDSLNAIRGVSNIMEGSEAAIRSIQGIPYIMNGTPSRGYGDATDYCHFSFVANLCWSHTMATPISSWHDKNCSEIRSCPDFPSWSWAGWKGGVIRFLFGRLFSQADYFFTLQSRQKRFKLYVQVFGFQDQNRSSPTISLTELSSGSGEGHKRLRYILLSGIMLPESICELDMQRGWGLFGNLVETDFENIRHRTMGLVLVMDRHIDVVDFRDSAFCLLLEWDDSEQQVIESKTLRVAWRRKLVAVELDRVRSMCGDLNLSPRTSFLLK